jgi:hypothetical protein
LKVIESSPQRFSAESLPRNQVMWETNQSSNASFSLSCQMKCSWAHPSSCFSFMHVCIWNPGSGSHWRASEEEEGGSFCG